jgi:hypothetical protein
MRVIFKTAAYQGIVRKKLVIVSNDPENAELSVTFEADIEAGIRIDPLSVLLKGYKDDEVRRMVTIRSFADQPLTLEPIKFTKPDKATYELVTMKKDEIYRVIFKNISRQKDTYRGKLILKTNYPQQPTLTVKFKGVISDEPKSKRKK